jgi:hypothetical protein
MCDETSLTHADTGTGTGTNTPEPSIHNLICPKQDLWGCVTRRLIYWDLSAYFCTLMVDSVRVRMLDWGFGTDGHVHVVCTPGRGRLFLSFFRWKMR